MGADSLRLVSLVHALLWRLIGLLLAVSGYVITTVVCAVILVVIGPPLMCLPRGKRERYAIWSNVLVSRMVLHLLCGARVRADGTSNIPRDKAYLVVANHRSWVDIPLVIATSRTQGISKLLVFFMPFLGQIGYLAGAVYFHRFRNPARKRALNSALYLLERGVPLHVYPEGTRTRDGEIRETVRLGLVMSCWEAGVPCVPTALLGTEKTLPVKGFFLRPFQTLHIHFLEPVQPADYGSALEFAEAVWGRVTGEVDAMRQAEAASSSA
ncbi:MAG: lysophospholipid acyltransferase family protein [Myxococcota bacterium]|nr:lysophospholipid acyltransferase family protein [Myxococcota bacterium]